MKGTAERKEANYGENRDEENKEKKNGGRWGGKVESVREPIQEGGWIRFLCWRNPFPLSVEDDAGPTTQVRDALRLAI